MRYLELLLRGALAGLALSAPVGPVNILCISRTLAKGRMAGLVSGLGAAAADTVYGAIAGFSISYIIALLVREEFWINLVGGILLLFIGVYYYFRRPGSIEGQANESAHSQFVTSFLLCLTNPTLVLSYLAVLASLGMGGLQERSLTFVVVAGIFCGAMARWILLAFVTSLFRSRFNDGSMVWMNRIAGMAIGGFGIFVLITSHYAPHK